MQVCAAANERDARLARAPPSRNGSRHALLLSESRTLLAGPPPLFQALSPRERELVLSHGRRRVLDRGQTLFSQDTPHEGIYLIESGRIRVFYNAPSGREITLAYWYPGNFVGGPDIFGTSVHLWSGVATSSSSVVQLPGKALRNLVMRIPALGIGLIEGLAFKGKCYSALVQMLGTRSVTERLAHLLLRPRRRRVHARRPRSRGRRDPAMGDHQPQAPARAGHRGVPQIANPRAPSRCSPGDTWRRHAPAS